MLELIAGILVATLALALVLEPLVRGVPQRDAAGGLTDFDLTEAEESGSPKIRALLALKELEFDRATGKLSDEDYASLKQKYSAQALTAIKQEEAATAAVVDTSSTGDEADAAEMVVARLKAKGKPVCPACGPRPEPSAVFCSACGRSLATPDALPRCWKCGSPLAEGAKFCGTCGGRIAA